MQVFQLEQIELVDIEVRLPNCLGNLRKGGAKYRSTYWTLRVYR